MHKQLRNRVLCLFILSILLILPGCAGNNDSASQTATTITNSNAEDIISITDDLGRNVEVPSKPERVLALTKNMMDELYELGVTPVGKVEEYKNRPDLKALPSVSNQDSPNLEAIYQLKPDLILANTRQHAQILEGLEKSGSAVVFIDPSKMNQDPLTDEVVLLGRILNRPDEAQAYVQRLNELSEDLQARISPAGYKTGLLLMGTESSMTAAQPTGVFGALLSRLGIENIVPKGLPGSGKSTWVAFDAETIIQENPDLIILRSNSKDKNEQENLKQSFIQNLQWSSLKAVQNGNVFILPPGISPGNCSNEDALQSTAKIIYPDGFTQQ